MIRSWREFSDSTASGLGAISEPEFEIKHPHLASVSARKIHITTLRRVGAVLFALGCITAAMPSRVAAQSVISVLSSGVPVPAAEVSIWDVQGQAGLGRTDGLGRVRIAPGRTLAPGTFVLVRRLGYAPARVPFEMRDSMTVAITAVAANLPVLAVRTKTLRCPQVTEPEADSLWRRSASRYEMGLAQFTIDWTGFTVGEPVTAEGRGYPNPKEVSQPPSVPFRSSGLPRDTQDLPPYAIYDRYAGPRGGLAAWRYTELSGYSAEHFLSERFRERHSLVMLGTSESATIIGFCPHDDSQADVQGELQIGANASLMGVRWSFRVPHHDEDAGGEATFAPTVYDGREYIVAISGASWRRIGKNLYDQRRFERTKWVLHPRG